jgi:pyruvate dehydrogenase E2 component (dihydrolipoamide acetyltransferase)
MATAVILPKLDEAMLTGTIVRWVREEGKWVEKGETILEIETEKVVFEIEAEESGILSKVMVKEGDEVHVGAIIAFILQSGEEAPEVPEPAIMAKGEVPATVPAASVKVPRAPKEAKAIKASPAAKKIAKEHNIDIATIKGTGPGGRIVKEDVLRAVEESKVAAALPVQEEPGLAEEEVVELSSMRKVIARRMTESFQVPHFYLAIEVDTREFGETRRQLVPLIENETGIRLTVTDLIIKMVAKALEDNPAVNCAYVDGSVKFFKRIDIGLVTAVEGGLLVPVIRQANQKSLAEIAQARAELTQRARDGKLSMVEMRDSTFTISNLGMFGIDQFSAVLQPPEAAILAVGRIADKAVARDGKIVIRPMMTLTLSIDHRVLDGVIGSLFLQSLKDYIENPASFFYGIASSP